jgi:hypothetical protein
MPCSGQAAVDGQTYLALIQVPTGSARWRSGAGASTGAGHGVELGFVGIDVQGSEPASGDSTELAFS